MEELGDNNQQQKPTKISEEINETFSSSAVCNYYDVVKVLSEVELPSPSPVVATSCTLTREEHLVSFYEGQIESSGIKNKVSDIEIGDNNQEEPLRTFEEITAQILHTSRESYREFRQTSGTLTRENSAIGLHEGQSSGTKRKAGDIEIQSCKRLKSNNVEREKEVKGKQHDCGQSAHQSVGTKINAMEKRRRNRISERIRSLKELVPNCNKRSRASVIGDAIEYIKFLQMQVQMIQSTGYGTMSQGFYNLSPPRQPSLQVPLTNMQHGIPQFGYYVPMNVPPCPPFFSGFPPLLPRMEVGTESFPWRQPRPLLYPQQLQFPSQK